MASTTIVDSFETGLENKKIKLKVSIEHAQIAKSTVRLNKKAVGEFDDSFEVELGNAKDLWGITLYVNTTEADIDPNSNKTSFTIELLGAEKAYYNKLEKTVAPKGFAVYTTEITFIP